MFFMGRLLTSLLPIVEEEEGAEKGVEEGRVGDRERRLPSEDEDEDNDDDDDDEEEEEEEGAELFCACCT